MTHPTMPNFVIVDSKLGEHASFRSNSAKKGDRYVRLEDALAYGDLVREACAKRLESLAPAERNCVWEAAYRAVIDDCAAAIRSMGSKGNG